MPRKPLIRSKEYPYHVYCRTNNKEVFSAKLSLVWKICAKQLAEIEKLHAVKVHAFVLMPNHFHLLMSTPESDLGVTMQHFMKSITKTINWFSGRSGRVFGTKYNWSLIDSENYYDCALKYVYRNPVKANICDHVEQYPFSTIQHITRGKQFQFNLHPISGHEALVPGSKNEFIEWLNIPFAAEEDKLIKTGLSKREFKLKLGQYRKFSQQQTVMNSLRFEPHDAMVIKMLPDT